MSPRRSPLELARGFVGRINAHDVRGLLALVTADHRFIDSLGHELQGEAALRSAWQEYFRMVPDYRIEMHRMFRHGPHVVVVGMARGTYAANGAPDPRNVWSVPGAWYAATFGGRIAEWRVFADTEPLRRCIAQADNRPTAPASFGLGDRSPSPSIAR